MRRSQGTACASSDGSGSIVVGDIGGDFTIEAGASGGIEHPDVRVRVRILGDHHARRR